MEMPTVRMRWRNMVIWCWTNSPVFVKMKLSKGICHGRISIHKRAIDTTGRLTNKDVLPTAIIPFEIQAVLPKVGSDRAVRLQVYVVRIPRPRIAAEA